MKQRLFLILAGVFFMQIPEIFAQKQSHYLFESLEKAVVIFNNGTIGSSSLNYNMATEEMIFEKDGQLLALDNLSVIDTIYIKNRIFIPNGISFLELIKGEYQDLYIQHKIKLISKGQPKGYGTTTQSTSIVSYISMYGKQKFYEFSLPEEFKVKYTPKYQIVLPENKVKVFKNKQEFLVIYKDRKAEMKKFIKQNKIRFNSPSGIHTLVNYAAQSK